MTRTVRLCGFDDVAPNASLRVDIDGHRIAVVRIDDNVYAIGDRCSHADYSLSEGEVLPESCSIECFKHGSSFSLVTGEPDSFPATRPVPVYAVRVEGNDIVVDLSEDDS